MNTFEERALLEAAIKGRDHYQWGTVLRPFHLARRGSEVEFLKGDEIGVRLSSSKTQYRLVNHRLGISVVFTLAATPDLRKSLLKNVKWQALRVVSPGRRIISTEEAHPIFSVNVEAAARLFARLAVVGSTRNDFNLDYYTLDTVLDGMTSGSDYDSLQFTNWYGSGSDLVFGRRLQAFVSEVFTCQSDKVDLFRWTALKTGGKPLPLGYAFRLDTSHRSPLQSWSRHPKGLTYFEAGYLLRARFPKKLVLVSDEAWEQLEKEMNSPQAVKAYSKHLETLLVKKRVDAESIPYILGEAGSVLKYQVSSIVNSCLAYKHEREVVVNASTGFKPLCEVLRHV